MTEVATEAPPQETSEQEPALKEGASLFKYSDYVHVGPGADVCDHMDDGECDDQDHFHAWVRLPNPFQHREISDKARAAQARKRRQLRDSETDGFVILEAEMDELRQAPTKTPIIEALVSRDWAEDYLQALQDLGEKEEWEGIQHDQGRMKEIEKEEGHEGDDEYVELGKHLAAYQEALNKRVAEITAPKKQTFEEKPLDELLGLLREQRVDAISTEDFLHTFGAWEMVVGVYKTTRDPVKHRHFERHFEDVKQLNEEPPEIIDALKVTLDALRVSHQEAGTGNP